MHRTPKRYAPVLRPFGWLALVVLLRWRSPGAWLVAALACIPRNLYFYDQLPLVLVAWNGVPAFVLTALSWVVWCVFIPAAVAVLLRDGWLLGALGQAQAWASARRRLTPERVLR